MVTEKKKWHKRWWFRVPVLAFAALVIISQFAPNGTGAINTCEKLIPQIITLSEKDRNPLKPKILKIYDAKSSTAPDNERELDCVGTAKRSSGDDSPLSFYLTKPDKDGDSFIGYEVR